MNTSLLSFNGGEVSPYLRHRIDFEKTSSSAEVMRNFLPMPYGGVIKRPGLQQLAELVAVGNNSRMLPFTASDGTKYVLHFTPDVLKIYSLDGTLKDTLDFMAGYEWPLTHDWENSIRDLHMIQVNDVAFFTHPGIFPLKLSRLSDTNWTLEFVPFKRPPLKDENADKTATFTVASNPVAATWAHGTSYAVGNKAFTDSEWICIAAHTASSTNRPGIGSTWRTYWRPMFYQPGDAITLLSANRSAVAWQRAKVTFYEPFTVFNSLTAGVLYLAGPSGFVVPDSTFNGVLILSEKGWLASKTTASPVCNAPTDKVDSVYTHVPSGLGGSFGSVIGKPIAYGGNIYRFLTTSTPYNVTPGVTAGWETYYEIFITGYSAIDPDWLIYHTTNELVSYSGSVWKRTALYPLAPATPDNAPPDAGFWELVSSMLPEFAMGDFSPGQYFMIAPNRPKEDFQIDLSGAASGTSSQIVIQGAWNFITFGTWFGTWNLQRQDNLGQWETVKSWEAKGDRNISATGTQEDPAVYRLQFVVAAGTPANSPRAVFSPDNASVKGYALMDTFLSFGAMTGKALTSLLSGNTDRWAFGAFNEFDGYPRAIALHESRLVFGGTQSQPITVWLSASDDLDNFETGVEADDAITATLATSAATPIRWLASQRRFSIGTKASEWICGSDTSDSPLTPETFTARQHTANGSCALQPLIYSGGMLFLTRKGTRLKDFGYSFERDSYDATDMSRLAEHLTAAGISNMAWQQSREPGLWAVTRDGGLLHFAYSRADNIMAWSQHDTAGGTFLDVVTFASDDGDDDVLFVVNREGVTFLERFPSGWQAAYEAGEGYLCEDPDNTPITSILQSMPIDSNAQDGTTQGRRKRVHKFVLSLYNSGGGKVWNRNQSSAQAIAPATPLTSAWVDVVPDAGHLDDCQLNILHDDPVPFILRMASIRWALHER